MVSTETATSTPPQPNPPSNTQADTQPSASERWKDRLFPTGDWTPQRITKYATALLIVCASAIVAAVLFSKFPAASYAFYGINGAGVLVSIYLLVTNHKKVQAEKKAEEEASEKPPEADAATANAETNNETS